MVCGGDNGETYKEQRVMRRTSRLGFFPVVAATLLLLLRASDLRAQAMDMPMGAGQAVHGLGSTVFPTTTKSAEAQTAFMRGLLLLHLFEYEDADASFVAAEKIDPGFSMAYWGDAMTYNHGVWNQVDVAAGKAALAKLAATGAGRAAKTADGREAAYLAAVEVLYDGTDVGAKAKAERDHRYADAMKSLSVAYPKDDNAQLFYALALIGQSEGVRDVPVYLQAASISKAIFRLEPNNPGAAHYWIHGMDDPEHAAGALEAARALSKIAPDAPHAQHMCSHIFMALGMWEDVVKSNEDAIRVGDLLEKGQGFPPYDCGHYPLWLEYGYLQEGRIGAAQQTIAACQATVAAAEAWPASHSAGKAGDALYGAKNLKKLQMRLITALAEMQETAVVEGQDWKAGVDAPELPLDAAAWSDFVHGYAAIQRKDGAAARAARADMGAKAKEYDGGKGVSEEDSQNLSVGVSELSGLLQVGEGHFDDGVVELQRAVAAYEGMAFAFGPPTTIKPPEEALGEVLLAKGDAAGAQKAFAASLVRAPRRSLSLLGLARAEKLGGDEAGAQRDYATLAEILKAADAGAVGVDEARKGAGR
jgi:hypothetical protein